MIAKKNATSGHSGEEPGKGLPWSTYFATVRRNGEYVSGSFGNVDFNQDLCEPVEKAFMVGWERTMNAALNRLLLKCEKEMVAAVQRGDKIVTSGGIRGKINKVIGDTDVEVEISSGVNVVIIKSTIAEVEKVSTS